MMAEQSVGTAGTLEGVRARLEAAGQGHLLAFYDELDGAGRAALLGQIGGLDLGPLPGLIEKYVLTDAGFEVPAGLEPAPYFPNDPAATDSAGTLAWDRAAAHAAGEALIRAGKVACFVVAGGQGSRLGYDGPKGCYPTGAVTDKPLFQLFAEQIRATNERYGVTVPWYVMTSPLNHDQTVAFFEEHDHLGLGSGDVMFFQQGVLPSLDMETGKVLLAEKGRAATNPDGHGGAIAALVKSGATADMKRRGVEHVSYFQVDNPHVRVVDPVFLGLHVAGGAGGAGAKSSGEVSSKMLAKAEPKEKVGNFCTVPAPDGGDRKVMVIEYSDLPDELAEQVGDDGRPRFIAGSIAIHAMSVAFIETVAGDPAYELPLHRANKKVPHIDLETGEAVAPTEPNGVKLEKFIFDAIPMAAASIVYETDRVEEFAPVKNKEGVDSIVTSKELQTERAARWIEAAGGTVPRRADGSPDCVLEIAASTAMSADDLRARVEGGMALPAIAAGASLAF